MDSAYLSGRGLVGGIVPGQSPGPEDLGIALGPSAYYTFDEPSQFTAAVDYANNGRNLTINGTPTQQVIGPSSYAIQLNSSTDYLVSTGTPLNLTLGTLVIWFKVSKPSTTSLLFGLFDSATVYDKTLVVNSDGSITFTVNDGSTRTVTIPATSVDLTRWNCLVATWGNGITLYLNGISVATGNCNAAKANYANANIYIGGGSPASGFAALPGKYDEIGIYPTQLNAGQVASIYSTGSRYLPGSIARITQVAIDVVNQHPAPHLRVSDINAEVVRNAATGRLRLSNFSIETVRTSAATVIHPVSVAQSLTFTETVSSTVAGSAHTINQTLSFTQTAQASVVHQRAVNQTLLITQSITPGHTGSQPVTQNLSYVQTVTKQKVVSISITDTLTFNQSVRRVHTIDITDTLAFTESTVGYDARHASQVLSFTETLQLNHNSNRQFLQALAFTQTVGLNRTAGLSVLQTLTFAQTVLVNVVRSKSVLQVLNLIDTPSIYQTHPASQTLDFNQTVTVYKTYSRAIAQSLAFTQTTSGIQYTPPSESGSATDTLTFDQSVSYYRVHNQTISQTLVFTEAVHCGPNIFNRSIEQTLEFQESSFKRQLPLLGPDGTPLTYNLPVAAIAKVKPLVILQSATNIIILPTPEWDDSESGNSSVDIKRSMTGKVRTYVKRSERLKLIYTFTLGREKSLELRWFLQNNLSSIMFLDNWKGERFIGTLGSNPTTFTGSGRYVGQFEKVSVTLEFQGVRLSG